jgi:TonB family protein
MSKRTLPFLLATLFILSLGLNAFGQASALSAGNQRRTLGASLLPLLRRSMGGVNEREQDGLNGPVRRVRTETAKLSNRNGQLVEGQRVPLEVAAYDIKGAKIENAYYPIPGAAITGKEVYKYDDKGNIIEMTLQDEKGTLLSKETYSYEFDQFGNWVKMTTSVAIIENGKLKFEPTEVTYRTISYYLDEATLAKMNQPAAPEANTGAAANAASGNPASNNNASASNAQPPSSAPAKPTAQPNVPANTAASNSNQSSPTAAANNKPVASSSSDASRQIQQSQASNMPASTSAPIVKTSAPVSDKAAATAQGEQANNSASTVKAVESKSSEDNTPKPVIKPLLKPVSGGVLNGKALNLPKPAYPLTARSARLSGLVVVEVVIDANGKVISARAVSGPVLLQQSAVQAAYQAKFSPTILSGQPVKVVGTINYNFLSGQ